MHFLQGVLLACCVFCHFEHKCKPSFAELLRYSKPAIVYANNLVDAAQSLISSKIKIVVASFGSLINVSLSEVGGFDVRLNLVLELAKVFLEQRAECLCLLLELLQSVFHYEIEIAN